MTTDERSLLEAVLAEVRQTHESLVTHIARSEAFERLTESMRVTLYGEEANEHRQGLKAQVASQGMVMKVCFAVCGLGLLILAVADTVLIVRALAW